MRSQASLWALHGFLGRPEDWNFLGDDLAGLHLEDLKEEKNLRCDNFKSWAASFNRRVKELPKTELNLKNNYLVGYSLGGRLALHALLDAPDLWQGAVIISAHPGLSSQVERELRYTQDQDWAQKIIQVETEQDWQDLMTKWNQQKVFQPYFSVEATAKFADRQNWAQILKQWSLAHQDDLTPLITKSAKPILWVTGEHDDKFCQIARNIKDKSPQLSWQIVPNAGHRVIKDKPGALKEIISEWLK